MPGGTSFNSKKLALSACAMKCTSVSSFSLPSLPLVSPPPPRSPCLTYTLSHFAIMVLSPSASLTSKLCLTQWMKRICVYVDSFHTLFLFPSLHSLSLSISVPHPSDDALHLPLPDFPPPRRKSLPPARDVPPSALLLLLLLPLPPPSSSSPSESARNRNSAGDACKDSQ